MSNVETKRIVTKVAAYVYAQAVLNQADNDYRVLLSEIEKHFGVDFFPAGWKKDIDFLLEIQDEIVENYPGCQYSVDTCWLDINGYDEYGEPIDPNPDRDGTDDAFDLVLYTNYIANDYDADYNDYE